MAVRIWLSDLNDFHMGSDAPEEMFGNGGDDQLFGNTGDDIMHGGAGRDVVMGQYGNDVLQGDAGIDDLYGGEGDDSVYGGEGDDTMFGDGDAGKYPLSYGAEEDGNDYLDGGQGNDFVVGGGGQDRLFGSDGDDTLLGDLMASFAHLYADPTDPVDYYYFPGPDVLYGGLGNDRLYGNEGNDLLYGEAGNDSLEGGIGNDYLDGGADNDMLIAGDGADEVHGGAGDDTLTGGTGNDQLYGMAGFDQIYGESGDDLLVGGPGGDKTGDHLYAGDGNDRLFGADGIDRLFGGNGNDELNAGRGADYMDGGAGDDTYVVDDVGDGTIESPTGGIDHVTARVSIFLAANVENLSMDAGAGEISGGGNVLNNRITGNGYANTLMGQDGNDQLFGMAGNDMLDGGTGLNYLAGGFGDDTYLVDDNGDTLTEVAGQGIDTVRSTMHYMLGDNVENLILEGIAAINATGNALDNTLTGNAANNLVFGGAGADTMHGGAGDDYYVIDRASDNVIELAGEGFDTVQTFVSATLAAEVEKLVLDPSNLAIDGTGNALDNTLIGNIANNRLDGGAGADAMYGGGGDDRYVADDAGDQIMEALGGGIDQVTSHLSMALAANVEDLLLAATAGSINGTGNDLNNRITGNDHGNILDGGVGADTLTGMGGDDTYVIDDSGDSVNELAGGGVDTVQSSLHHTLGANLEALRLTGTADLNGTGNGLDNTLIGNAGNNTVMGNDGSDTMFGAAGNDTLEGGAGNDKLDGGSGADTLRGGGGNDSYMVDHALDVIEESTNAGTDSVQSKVSQTLSANVEHLTLTGTAAINATGNALNNTLMGNSAKNVLSGETGNDVLNGGGGVDILLGGDGSDIFTFDALDLSIAGTRYDGGIGGDTLRFTGGAKSLDLITLSDERVIGIEIVDLTGSGNNKLAFSASDLKALSDTDAVRIDGNAGDVVSVADAGWTPGADLSFGQNLYRTFLNDGAMMLVDTDVSLAFA